MAQPDDKVTQAIARIEECLHRARKALDAGDADLAIELGQEAVEIIAATLERSAGDFRAAQQLRGFVAELVRRAGDTAFEA